jgi:hypothetical protein
LHESSRATKNLQKGYPDYHPGREPRSTSRTCRRRPRSTNRSFRAIVLTFLAGTDIDPYVVKRNFASSVSIGLMELPALAERRSLIENTICGSADCRCRSMTNFVERIGTLKRFTNDHLVVAAGMRNRRKHRRKIDLAALVGEPWILSPSHISNYARLAEAFKARREVARQLMIQSGRSELTLTSSSLVGCLIRGLPGDTSTGADADATLMFHRNDSGSIGRKLDPNVL